MSSVRIECAASQDNGRYGQDAYSCEPDKGFFAVSDGTSNFEGSGATARAVVDGACQYIDFTKRAIVSFGGMTNFISRSLQSEEAERGCATLLAAFIHCRDERALVRIGTAGDSVGYLISDKKIILRTPQHYTSGPKNEKILSTFFDSRTGLYFLEHPPKVYRHHLLINQFMPQATVLLLSDGITDGLSDEKIAMWANDTARFPTAQSLANFLVASSKDKDDKTAIVIRLLPG